MQKKKKKNPSKNEKKKMRERTFFCGKTMHKMRENCKFIVRRWEYEEAKIKEDKGIEEG